MYKTLAFSVSIVSQNRKDRRVASEESSIARLIFFVSSLFIDLYQWKKRVIFRSDHDIRTGNKKKIIFHEKLLHVF